MQIYRPAAIAVALLLSACGGGGSSGPVISEAQAIAEIQSKLSEESAKLMQRITAKVQEASASVGGLTCTQTHIDLAQTMASTEVMQGLNEFNRWVLAYNGATPAIKYDIGRVLDNSNLPSQSELAYTASMPCNGPAITTSAAAISQYAVYEVISVRDSLRRAGLLAP